MDTREKLFNECKYTSMQIFVRVNDFEKRFLRSIIVDKYIANNTSTRDKGKKRKRIKKKNVRLDKFGKLKKVRGFFVILAALRIRRRITIENYASRELLREFNIFVTLPLNFYAPISVFL